MRRNNDPPTARAFNVCISTRDTRDANDVDHDCEGNEEVPHLAEELTEE
jgi:hypothetical protein